MQKKHQHQRDRKWRSTKGKSIRSGTEHQTDIFEFKISKDKPATKRGMLSKLSSVYDPLGLELPVILKGRRIIQKLCQGNTAWDDTLR